MTDRPDYPPYQMHPALQLLVFIAFFVVILVVGNLIGLGIAAGLFGLKTVTAVTQLDFTSPHAGTILWILQFAGTTFPIFAAPVFFAFVVARDPRDYLKTTFRFPWPLILLVLAIMFISNPAIEILSDINQKMSLPPWLQWMSDSQKNADKLMGLMLDMKTAGSLVFNIIFVALLTGIVEEFMFRGVLQTIFVRLTKNTHVAIWITAILFSAFHMEFFGFLPRLLLGVLFGYFVAWSGSIWPAVWAHFLNNGTAVVATYLFQHKIIKDDPDNQHLFSAAGYIISFAIMLFLLFVYRKVSIDKKQLPSEI
jgi:uncharacterized protein